MFAIKIYGASYAPDVKSMRTYNVYVDIHTHTYVNFKKRNFVHAKDNLK